jgi:starch phosphorylase
MTKTPRARTTPARLTQEDTRTGLSPQAIARAFCDNLFYVQGRFPKVATPHDRFMALAYTVRDRLLQRWIHTAETYYQRQSRTVCYLSAEFLLGPQLGKNLINLGIYGAAEEAMKSLGLDLGDILEQEEEPGLGNGGLGRLAACYIDSLATLEIPTIAYGIRYEFGIFNQAIRDGWQVEMTDKWLRLGNPWEIARPQLTFGVKLGGHTETYTEDGRYKVRWNPSHLVRGTAYDTPTVGYHVNTANFLRLWRAEATESFDFRAFNTGDYYGAVMEKIVSENITKVLYPNDELPPGKQRAPGHDPAPSANGAQRGGLRPQVRRATERHPSGHRDRGVDAPDGRRVQRGLGPGVAGDAKHVRLHEPHPAARSARAVAGPAFQQPPAAAPRDHLRDQPPLPRRGAGALPRR